MSYETFEAACLWWMYGCTVFGAATILLIGLLDIIERINNRSN